MADKSRQKDRNGHTEAGGEAGKSQLHSRHKKGHMTNIYLTSYDKEAIVNFLKDHKELYNKTNEYFKTRPGKNAFGRG